MKAGRLGTEVPESEDEEAEEEPDAAEEEEQPGAAAHEELVQAAKVETPPAPARVRKIDFVSRRNWYFLFSLLIIIPGIYFMVHSGFALGIDFAGGTEFTVRFTSQPTPTQAQVESAVATLSPGGSVISLGGGGYIIRTPPLSPAKQTAFEDQLRTSVGAFTLDQVLEVGGTIARETIRSGLISGLAAAVVILALLTFRLRNVPRGI